MAGSPAAEAEIHQPACTKSESDPLFHAETQSTASTAPTLSPPLPSPKRLSWHLLREPDELDAEAAAAVARVLQDDEAAKVIDLGRRFCRIVRGLCNGMRAEPSIIAAFDTWLSDA